VINKIAIDPKNEEHLIIAASSTFEWGYNDHGMWESFDGGISFQKFGENYVPFKHATPYVSFSLNGKRIVVGGHPGGEDFFISEDQGKSWEVKNGLWGDFISDVAQFPDKDKFLVTLYWSAVFYTDDGGETWEEVSNLPHSNLHSVYSPSFDPDRLYAAAHSNGIHFSKDKGNTWQRVSWGDEGLIHESIIHNYESSASRFSPDLLWIRGEYSSEVVILRDPETPKWSKIDVPGDMSSVLAHPNMVDKAFVGADGGLYIADYNKLNLNKITEIKSGVNSISGDEERIVVGSENGVWISIWG